jgi:hypothetical protein
MRAFELLCDYLYIPASKNVFFSFFIVQRGANWVSFRQTQNMFEIFAGKVWSFKERFFLVRPKSVAALDNLLEVAKDGVQERRPFFHLCWSQDQFAYEPRILAAPSPILPTRKKACVNNFGCLFSLFCGGSRLTNGETH